MSKLVFGTVLSLLIWLFKPTEAFPRSGHNLGVSETWRDVHCRDDLEYLNSNICCLNCPAGTRMISPCTKAGQKGKCEECDYGTYTEHTNSLKQCFKCTQCRPDQEIVRACTHTLDAECRCKSGRFCAPDQACEVCKKCSRCEKDEAIVRNCTSTANTECKKNQAKSGSASAKTSVIVLLSLLAAAVIIAVVICVWRRRATGSQGNLSDGLKAEKPYSDIRPAEEGRNGGSQRLSCSSLILTRQLVRAKSSVRMEDERKVLCESLNSSASNSQHSLTSPNAYSSPAHPPRAGPTPPTRRENEHFPQLVALNGEQSLRKCFDYFEEIDVDYHKRFFRQLGINDNVIKGKEPLPYEDKIHELLNIWIEKEGRDASLNDLLRALLDLNQRRTAENIKENAVHHGHYLCED